MKRALQICVALLLLLLLLTGCSATSGVEKKINEIGTVTLESEAAIVAAEQAFNELKPQDQAKVTNAQVLTEARQTYDSLVERKAQQEEEARKKKQELQAGVTLAERVITKMGKIYKNPLNLKIKKVWYHKYDIANTEHWYFTYLLQVKNSVGILQEEYWGISLMEGDIAQNITELDQLLGKQVSFWITLGQGVYWRKDNVSAMQIGTQMDAGTVEFIQTYYMQNYGR